jgi:hypothetical protein
LSVIVYTPFRITGGFPAGTDDAAKRIVVGRLFRQRKVAVRSLALLVVATVNQQ